MAAQLKGLICSHSRVCVSHVARRWSAYPVRSVSSTSSQCLTDALGIPGLTYLPDFVDRNEESLLLSAVDYWSSRSCDSGGRCQRPAMPGVHFQGFRGADGDLTDRAPPPSVFEASARALARLKATGLVPEDHEFDTVLVQAYSRSVPGSRRGITMHKDRPMYGALIVGISLGAPVAMEFRPACRPPPNSCAASVGSGALLLEPRSCYVLAGPARWEWLHGIPRKRVGSVPRVSLTFRQWRSVGL